MLLPSCPSENETRCALSPFVLGRDDDASRLFESAEHSQYKVVACIQHAL